MSWGRRAAGIPLRWWVVACVALSLLLRGPWYSAALGIDEGGVALVAKAWSSTDGSLYGRYWIDRPPLLLVLYRLAVAGGDAGVRALGAVSAVVTIVLVAVLARRLGGLAAGRVGAVLVAAFAASPVLQTVFTTGEVLAGAFSVGAVLAAVRARETGRGVLAAVAGCGAVCAVLVKQSFVDALAATVVLLALGVVADRGRTATSRRRVVVGYLLGVSAPVAATGAYVLAAAPDAGAFLYAWAGFRADALVALGASSLSPVERVGRLWLPFVVSGLALTVPWAVAGARRLARRDAPAALALLTWLAAGTVGVLGGGYYWSHYLIQVVAPLGVLAALGLTSGRACGRVATVAAVLGVAVLTAVGSMVHPLRTGHQEAVQAVAAYVREHSCPADTIATVYARANVLWYSGLQAPYPYQWSSMLRVLPDAEERLHRLLTSPGRPTWLVRWQDEDAFGMDAQDRISLAVTAHYRLEAVVRGKEIYVRADRPRGARDRADQDGGGSAPGCADGRTPVRA